MADAFITRRGGSGKLKSIQKTVSFTITDSFTMKGYAVYDFSAYITKEKIKAIYINVVDPNDSPMWIRACGCFTNEGEVIDKTSIYNITVTVSETSLTVNYGYLDSDTVLNLTIFY